MKDLKYLIVGLGNPGPKYHLTRHNVGFFFVDHLADLNGLRIESAKLQGLFRQEQAFGAQVLYLKPQAYMNRSGECVRAFVDYFKIALECILVLHDDIDLMPGRIKIVGRGGAGGHNGIRSIIQHLGTQEFARMKIGIGRPPVEDDGHGQPVDKFVLAKMTAEELALFRQRQELVQEAVEIFVRNGIDACMRSVNGQ